MSDYKLKYLFEARFNDGTIYTQHPEDLPQLQDKGSSFTDILPKLDKIDIFGLFEPNTLHNIGVDLNTGCFFMNGQPFLAKDPDLNVPIGTKYRLIYFRKIQRTFQGNIEINLQVEYHIGWQVTIGEKNYKQTIAII